MKVTSCVPTSWKNLQDEVCRFLNEAGYSAESPKTIQTVRGTVEVDVHAKSEKELIQSFICECKYWSTPIPQEKIHAFRTVTSDSGSMLGIVISKNGFQKGAYEAAYCSNILLKDWDGFIKLIEKQWVVNKMLNMAKICSPLSVYTDPTDVPYLELSDHNKKIYMENTKKCLPAYLSFMTLDRKKLQEDSIELDNRTFYEIDDLMRYYYETFTESINIYENIFKNNPVDQWKLEIIDPSSRITISEFMDNFT
ncbi:restriction endonuclease [Enterococcus sp. B1E4]|uniref:restriction endonuclease n=1 Tax=Enterococcus sp. B1E4 TaxID=3061044 RepID=UPI00265C8A24|nr:restriction endonuclease [Enterococcus sp. B1E4]MDO0896219.1 restriction endonuclease [Enterococcus sp. B1E4]